MTTTNTNGCHPDPAAIHAWYRFSFSDAPGRLVIWDSATKRSATFATEELEAAARETAKRAESVNVYHGCGLQAQALDATERGTADQVLAIPGAWHDIDVAGPGHKAKAYPPSEADAMVLLTDFPLPPTAIVHSGHGLQPWWFFREPWVIESVEERERAASFLRRFQATLSAHAKARGWELDGTHDLARVLRAPGTVNRKPGLPPVLVTLRELHPERRYDPGDFEPYLIAEEEEQQNRFHDGTGSEEAERPHSSWTPEQIEAHRENVTDTEILNMARNAKNGEKFCKLFDQGDVSGHRNDASDADSALVAMLAFYTGPDPERIDRLFKQSKLCREKKWNEKRGSTTYGYFTIAKWLATSKASFYTGERPESEEIEGPLGLTFIIQSFQRTSRRKTVTIEARFEKETVSGLIFNSTTTSLEKAAKEILSIVPPEIGGRTARLAIQRALRDLINRAEKKWAKRPPRPLMLAILEEEARDRLALAFVTEEGNAWSEKLGRFVTRTHFINLLEAPAVIARLRDAEDFEDGPQQTVIFTCEKLAGSVWAQIIQALPYQDEADLGPLSKAAREVRRRLIEVLTRPVTFSHDEKGVSLMGRTLASQDHRHGELLAYGKEPQSEDWYRPHSSYALWYRFTEKGIMVALRWEILHQVKPPMVISGVRDQKTFAAILRKYGLADRINKEEGVRVGHESVRAVALRPKVAEAAMATWGATDLSASGGAAADATDTPDAKD